ncbi:MAG: hypothetical protein Kow0077_29750 [Anaerolineae bacterium]
MRLSGIFKRDILPPWARLDHPLVQRELEELPNFLGDDGNLNLKMVLLALVGVGLVSCSCACSGLLWPVMMLGLGTVPLIWGAMLVNRERAAGRWDMLRVTPYSVREILLAKIMAVTYRLTPLLALLLAGQAMSFLSSIWLMNYVMFSATLSLNGQSVLSTGSDPVAASSALVAGVGLAFVLTLFTTLLDFALNIVVGLLASTLVLQRGWAYAAAVGLRMLITLVGGAALAGVSVLLLRLADQGGGLDGFFSLLLTTMPGASLLGGSVLSALLIAGQVIALVVSFRLAERYAAA